MYEFKIDHVSKITNGDTLQLVVNLGFHIQAEVAVRLLGVQTPEFGSYDRSGVDKGQEARNFTVNWLKVAPGPLVLHTQQDRRDGFNRWLGMVFDSNGESLNDTLISNGLGVEDIG